MHHEDSSEINSNCPLLLIQSLAFFLNLDQLAFNIGPDGTVSLDNFDANLLTTFTFAHSNC